jgi:hypothetical protein
MHCDERKESAAHQWQGRAVHPDLPARAGLRPDLCKQPRVPGLPACLTDDSARKPHSALGYKPPACRPGGKYLLQLNSLKAEQIGVLGIEAR